MIDVNFFESVININVMIHRGGHVVVSNKSKKLFEGDQFYCMSNIRQIVDKLSSLGNKKIVFYIQNMTVEGSSSVVFTRNFFRSNLEQLKKTAKCTIEVKSGLNGVFA